MRRKVPRRCGRRWHLDAHGAGRGSQRTQAGKVPVPLLEVQQNVYRSAVRVFLKEPPDLFVVKWKTDECLLNTGVRELFVDFLVKNCALSDTPGRANAALAFDRKSGQDKLSHVVHRSLGN